MKDLMYNVIWIEDDDSIVRGTQIEALQLNINLVQFPNWRDAYRELSSNFEKYSAIVFDAFCIYDRTGSTEQPTFLSKALAEMNKLFGIKQCEIPWYIYSAGTMTNFDDAIEIARDIRKDSPKEWGEMLFQKGAYLKDGKTSSLQGLCETITTAASLLPANVIMFRHSELFGIVDGENIISNEARQSMIKLLAQIYMPDKFIDYELQGNNMRKVYQGIFDSAIKFGIMPGDMAGYQNNGPLQEQRRFLCGENPENGKYRFGKPGRGYRGVGGDSVFSDSKNAIFEQLIKFTNEDSHKYADYTRELFFCHLFALCDLIIEYGHYLASHSDKEANLKLWTLNPALTDDGKQNKLPKNGKESKPFLTDGQTLEGKLEIKEKNGVYTYSVKNKHFSPASLSVNDGSAVNFEKGSMVSCTVRNSGELLDNGWPKLEATNIVLMTNNSEKAQSGEGTES